MASEWWVTARPGDRVFGGMVVRAWNSDGGIGILWDGDDKIMWYGAAGDRESLARIIPDHVGSMRRHVEAVLTKLPVATLELHHPSYLPFDGILNDSFGDWFAYNCDTDRHAPTPTDAVAMLIPDDWQPPAVVATEEIARRDRVRRFVAEVDRNPPLRVSAAELTSIDRGLADFESGRSYSHEQVERIVAAILERN